MEGYFYLPSLPQNRVKRATMFEEKCKCSICPLRLYKDHFGSVKGEIVGDATKVDAVFIGISPAKEELRLKRPMIGLSGTLGRKTAKRVGYENYYITNSMLCYYPDEATKAQIQKAVECCRPRLEEELKYFKPKVIVPMGAVPTAAVLKIPEVGILSIEAKLQDTEYGPVIPVRQPAAVLRRADEYPDFEFAMGRGVRLITGQLKTFHQPKTVIVRDTDTLGEVLETLSHYPELAIDLETTKRGFFPYGTKPDGIRSIGLAGDTETGYVIPANFLDESESKKRIKELLETTKGIYHNGGFDCGFLMQAGINPKIYYDTLLAHFLIDERGYAHGLEKLAVKYLDADPWKGELEKYLPTKKSSYDLVPDNVLYPYQARDICYTMGLKEIFQSDVSAEGKGVFAQLLMPCANMFNEIRHKGIRIDLDELMTLEGRLSREVSDLEEEIRLMVGYPLNPSSPQEVCALIYDKMGLPMNPQMGRTSSKKILNGFKDIDEVEKILTYREVKKLAGTYVRGLAKFIDLTWRIHPYTKLFGAETGRISTEDPSVMNITKKGGIKSIYLPEEGEELLELDFSGMELRAYAVVTQDQVLLDRMRIGDRDKTQDVHNTVMRAIIEQTKTAVTRGAAKTGVFGRMYRRGQQSFERGFKTDAVGAKAIMDLIDSIIPSLPIYHKWVGNTMSREGELVSYFGRRRRFPLITDSNRAETLRQGVNFLIQSMASDVNLFCMLHMYRLKEVTGATPLFPVHDSIVFSIKDRTMIPVIQREVERYAGELVGGDIPFLTEGHVGPSWGSMEEVIRDQHDFAGMRLK